MYATRIFLFATIFSISLSLSAETSRSVLFVVDMDGTLGEQSAKPLDFSNHHIARVPNDPFGDFYFFNGALEFMKTLFTWRDESKESHNLIHIALFTMGSGSRNEIVRNYLADALGISRTELNVFDYSEAVFSENLVERWRQKDPGLKSSQRDYFDSLDKPIKHTKPMDLTYVKDLSKLLPYYSDVLLEHVLIFDDNPVVVPIEQLEQLIVAKPTSGYQNAIDRFQNLLLSLQH